MFSLNRKTSSASREGVLLKIEFSSELLGYCDLHPHPELGDVLLKDQLERLKNQTPTLQTKNSLHWALVDAHARKKGESVFNNLKLPTTHLTWTELDLLEEALEQAHQLQYTHLKLKTGRDPERELQILHQYSSELKAFRLRFDFNEALSREAFESWWKKLNSDVKSCVDYVEDPFPFNASDWARSSAPLALDRGLGRESLKEFSHNVIVFKPAISDLSWLNSMNKRTIFSTYMDHPLGEMAAIYAAAHYYQTHDQIEVCGLKTWPLFETNEFSEVLLDTGSKLSVAPGSGFGFDDLLQKQKWSVLF